MDLDDLELTLVLPNSFDNFDDFDFDSLNCTYQCSNNSGDDADIVDDSDILLDDTKPVVELIGNDSKINFPLDCRRQYLVFHIKTIKSRFFKIFIIVKDDLNRERLYEISSKRTIVSVDSNYAQLPLNVTDNGWQRICLDLDDITKNAFGTTYLKCVNISVTGTCRVGKIYFQSKDYADVELPPCLRVVDNSVEYNSSNN